MSIYNPTRQSARSTCPLRRLALGFSFAFCCNTVISQQAATWKSSRTYTAPKIDGILDEPIWLNQAAITEFRQVEPTLGEEPSQGTAFYLAYDSNRLYFAMVANDSDPEAIVATQLKRDADLSGDDNVVLVIDPFLDKRNGYYFSFNALGARQDALIRGGVTLNTDWDGIWDVVTKRSDTGWITEGSIPISTISFDSQAPAWGLNIERVIARTGERIRWNGTQRQYLVNNLANTGRLIGLSDLRRASGIELRPFTTVTYANDRTNGAETTRFDPGFDLFYKLTESTTAVLTINTDFADAEVDDRVVNLTRFPVNFPEKRAFFLQDAGVFSYSLINNNPLPYYSRRIGLGPRGEVVDINAGARISGREGPINFGILGVSTDASGDIEAKELGVARVQWTLTDETNIGTIATYGDPRTNGDAWLVGFDLNHTTGQFLGRNANLLDSSLYFQRTGATSLDGDSDAYDWGLIYDSPTWGFVSYLDRVGEDYYPALGSVRQTGVYTVTGKIDYELNPKALKSFVPNLSYVRRYNMIYNDREQETVGAEFTAETQRGTLCLSATAWNANDCRSLSSSEKACLLNQVTLRGTAFRPSSLFQNLVHYPPLLDTPKSRTTGGRKILTTARSPGAPPPSSTLIPVTNTPP
ncbi:DUF5916 domain-containing protein [Pelagicoccus sp. SDUM812002]|uniref:carbohydrate binding family 9 domain-containing protein n=1 Tax=Pelagicoccus sp. SDUM812002 TaxID=3041266 RepID=UPI00280CE1D4|nr:DUF5916 domain-containing protein [Pelagicoccus sp. SDUM812002]MDQ8184486.1 DUF5916 domain-containing protein [Pelagicoccus sp. SDUM812002]